MQVFVQKCVSVCLSGVSVCPCMSGYLCISVTAFVQFCPCVCTPVTLCSHCVEMCFNESLCSVVCGHGSVYLYMLMCCVYVYKCESV